MTIMQNDLAETKILQQLSIVAWIRLLGCCTAKFAVSFAVSEAFVLVPLEAEHQGTGAVASMAILAAQPVAYVACSPLAGRWLDERGAKTKLVGSGRAPGDAMLLVSLAAVGLGSWLLGVEAWWPSFLGARLLQGAGGAAGEVAAMVLVAEVFPKERLPSAEGLLETATGLGYAFGLPAAGWLYGGTSDHNEAGTFVPFAVGAGTCMVALLCAAISSELVHRQPQCALPEGDGYTDEEEKVEQQLSEGSVLKRTRVLAAGIFLYGALMGDVYASLAVVNEHTYHLKPAQSGALLMLIAASYIIVCPLIGWVCDGPIEHSRHCLACGLVLGIFAYALLALQPLVFEGIGLLVLGVSEAMFLIPAWPVLLDLAGGNELEAAGAVSAVLNTSYLAGESVGPFLSLLLVRNFGFHAAMGMQAVLVAASALAVCAAVPLRTSARLAVFDFQQLGG